jgi:hypothetical protein
MSNTVQKAELKRLLRRPASLLEFFGPPPMEFDLSATMFGRVTAGFPGEEWPVYRGRLMQPVAQLNLLEAPYLPENLRDVALIALFFDRDARPIDAENGDGWLLRSYPALDDLCALTMPAEFERARGSPARYRLLESDFPDWEDAADLAAIPEDLADAWEDDFGSTAGSKLGGWPSLLQSKVSWAANDEHPAAPKYAFQIARMDKLKTAMPADSFGYFGRGTGTARNVWTFAYQLY